MLLLGLVLLVCSSTIIKADDTITDQSKNAETSPTPIKSADELPNDGSLPIKPTNNLPDLPQPNIFHNFFNHFVKPLKVSGKTYGPSIIAVIGDKPYISLEVFNKLSPFKWLMHAFQGKIQSLCGLLAPPEQHEIPGSNPQNLLEQILQVNNEKPPGSTVLGSGSLKIYDIPANGIRKKLGH